MSPLDVVQKLKDLAIEVEHELNVENSRGGEARVILDKLYRDVCADDVAIFGWEDSKLRDRVERVWDRVVDLRQGNEVLRRDVALAAQRERVLQQEIDRLRSVSSSERVSDSDPVTLLEDSLGQIWEAGRKLLRDL